MTSGIRSFIVLLSVVIVIYVLFSLVDVVEVDTPEDIQNGCKVRIHNTSMVAESAGPQQPCTWNVFRHGYLLNDYFPSSGTWKFTFNGVSKGAFLPKTCSFGDRESFQQRGLQCFREKHWRKIVTMGDSNGAGYFKGLWNFVETFSDRCEVVKKEMTENEFVPDKEYFSRGWKLPPRAMNISRRTCRTCVARNHKCSLANTESDSSSQDITIEHLALTSLNDTTLITLSSDQGGVPRVTPTKSTAEFYFKLHLKERMPDVLIIAPPFIHERETSVKVLSERLRNFRYLLATYVPSTVKVVWLPQLTTWRYPDPIFHNMTGNEKNSVFNRELFNQLRDSITDISSNWFGFYDLQSVTCPMKSMSKDGVHLDPVYYRVMMEHLVMLLCGDS